MFFVSSNIHHYQRKFIVHLFSCDDAFALQEVKLRYAVIYDVNVVLHLMDYDFFR